MRSAFFVFLFGFLAYKLWDYYDSMPAAAKIEVLGPVAERPAGRVDVAPDSTASDAVQPDLENVPVKGAPPLTHAKVTSVTPTGIVFLCDQGLVEVRFDRLSPAFTAFYTPKIVRDPVAPVPASPAPKAQAQVPVAKSAVQDEQDRLAFTQARMGLRDRIAEDDRLITQWYKQSSFDNPTLSESQFMTAKADRDATALRLAELEANGPGH